MSLGDAHRRLAAVPEEYVELFRAGDTSLELYAPRGSDRQTPHDRDELYVVASGNGTFVRSGNRTTFAAGDVLFADAHEEHRFENFSDDFSTWVVFFGQPK
jgi:mannose-6-phosphate isomerase-like protein (cupin superfamily)